MEKKDPMMRCTFFWSVGLVLFFFFFKITRPSNYFEFSKLPLPTLNEFNFPGNFFFVRLQIKIVSIILVIIFSTMVLVGTVF